MMFTAILPVRTGENSFWSSKTGLSCIDRYLNIFVGNSFVEQICIVSRDPQVQNLAEKNRTQVVDLTIPGCIDRPFTFEQTMDLACQFKQAWPDATEDLLIADPRNLSFTRKVLKQALEIYLQDPEKILVSLAFCRDHPCQYRTYYIFLGCSIFYCKKEGLKKEKSEQQTLRLSDISKSIFNGLERIDVSVHFQETTCYISVACRKKSIHGLVAQIIPFNGQKPLYEQSLELFIEDEAFKNLPGLDADSIDGVIVTLLAPDTSGAYDVIEYFTPEKADWELSFIDNVIRDKKAHTFIQGRQQFSPAYTYDGSLCLFHKDRINRTELPELVPFISSNSFIVSDWIDYCRIKPRSGTAVDSQ